MPRGSLTQTQPHPEHSIAPANAPSSTALACFLLTKLCVGLGWQQNREGQRLFRILERMQEALTRQRLRSAVTRTALGIITSVLRLAQQCRSEARAPLRAQAPW
jgi:hypothetical protein